MMYQVPITRLKEVMAGLGDCTATTGQPCTAFHGVEQLLNDGSKIILGHAVDERGNDLVNIDQLSHPERLDTKADYLFVKDFFSKGEYEKDYQLLLDDSEHWVETQELATPDDGITDEKHKVDTRIDIDQDKKKYYQMEKQINPDCKLFKLGFTIEEVDVVIKEIEAKEKAPANNTGASVVTTIHLLT